MCDLGKRKREHQQKLGMDCWFFEGAFYKASLEEFPLTPGHVGFPYRKFEQVRLKLKKKKKKKSREFPGSPVARTLRSHC